MFSQIKRLSVYSKIAIFSDIHIEGDFYRENKLLDYIDSIIHEYDYIVLNGDIFECLRFSKTHWKHISQMSKLKRIIESFPRLKKYLAHNKFIFVIGNHDYVLKYYSKELENSKMTCCETLYNDRLGFIIEHGHQAEYSSLQLEDSLRTKWYYTLLDFFILQFYKLFKINKLKGDDYISDIMYTATDSDEVYKNYVQNFNFKNVILGHTHQFGQTAYNKHVYFNSGSCLRSIQYIEITTAGKFNLIEVPYGK